jgi:uncharacterized Zn finger protein
MGYWGSYYPAYVSVGERRAKAEKAAAKAKKSGVNYTPIEPYRGAVTKTFWGKAWCDNLEAYSDYANRLPRGRTYVRNGSVIDLQIKANTVQALVMGSSLYSVDVHITQVPKAQWQAICTDCASSIDTLVDLLQGKLAKPVMERICKPLTGLFPSPKEIRFTCDCPDSAGMCKHIAAVMYGVGARLDQKPELLFTLRQVDTKDLVAQAGSGLPAQGKRPTSSKMLDDSALADVFGLEMDEPVAAPLPKTKPTKAAAKTAPTKRKKASAAAPAVKAKVKVAKTPAKQKPSTSATAQASAKKSSAPTEAPATKPVVKKPAPKLRPKR